MHFQKIKPFNKKQINHVLNKGLVHQDSGVLLAGVVYLNKKPDLNSGTSIYMSTKKRSKEYDEKLGSKKKEIYKVDQNKLTKKEIARYEKLIKDCNSIKDCFVLLHNKFEYTMPVALATELSITDAAQFNV